ncbi:MAG: hypothetical protein IT350_11880 [Deltaproteobacteria bacterium]|nr:hypothetical protein [Deltaproteobacteria bacterium]
MTRREVIQTAMEVCRLKREVYPDFPVRHFHEFAVREHGLKLGCTWTLIVLQQHGSAQKAPRRGQYRRKGRLPQELRPAGIRDYVAANEYLERRFVPDFNRRFTVEPAQPESAFVRMAGLDLSLLLSVRHERKVRADNTVLFENRTQQLPSSPRRTHFARCPVIVHEMVDRRLAVSCRRRLVARFDRDGEGFGRP